MSFTVEVFFDLLKKAAHGLSCLLLVLLGLDSIYLSVRHCFKVVVLKYVYMRNKRRSYASPRLSHIDFLTLQCRATVVARNYGEPVSLPVQMVDLHHRPKKEMSRCPHDPVIEIFQIPPVARIFLGFRWIYVIITTSITITTSISISIT